MEVAYFHDDPISRIPLVYDPQSSPGSVDSINSTDAGPVSAIAAVAPAYRHQYNTDFNKSAAVKAMNLPLKSGTLAYSQHSSLGSNIDLRQGGLPSGGVITANPSVVSSGSFQHTGVITNSYAQQQQGQVSSSNNSLSVTIPDYTPANNNTLSTPDLVNMLKAGSPDFSQNTQSSIQNATPFFSRNVTQEQEMYAQGFVRELERLKAHEGGSDHEISHSPNSESGNAEVSQCSVITSGLNLAQQHHQNHPLQRPHQQHYASPDPYYHEGPSSSGYAMSTIHHMGNPNLHPNQQMGMSPHMLGLKEEQPQTVPVLTNSPPVSPINMEHQEVIKTERKRMRNRLAASKCRKRKLERISRLEEKVNSLKNQNLELSTNANLLRQQVSELKSKVMAHVNSGCQLMMTQQQVAF